MTALAMDVGRYMVTVVLHWGDYVSFVLGVTYDNELQGRPCLTLHLGPFDVSFYGAKR